jgi:hypothetical protein
MVRLMSCHTVFVVAAAWWAELSPADSSPSCSPTLLSVHPSGTSEGYLGHSRSSSNPSAAAFSTEVNKLRVASCPAMEHQQGRLRGGSTGSSSGAASGESTPWGSGVLAVDRTGSASSSYLRALVGKQPGKTSGR